MNYYQARQRSETGVWDYTCRNDDRITPEGYCRQQIGCPAWTIDKPFDRCEASCEHCHGEQFIENPAYCGGHDTAELAEACFARFLLDQGSRETTLEGWAGCEHKDADGVKCDEPTKILVESTHPLGHQLVLCSEHRTAEAFTAAAPRLAGQITASY